MELPYDGGLQKVSNGTNTTLYLVDYRIDSVYLEDCEGSWEVTEIELTRS